MFLVNYLWLINVNISHISQRNSSPALFNKIPPLQHLDLPMENCFNLLLLLVKWNEKWIDLLIKRGLVTSKLLLLLLQYSSNSSNTRQDHINSLTLVDIQHWRGNFSWTSRCCSPPWRCRPRRPPPWCCSWRGWDLWRSASSLAPALLEFPGLPSWSKNILLCQDLPLHLLWKHWSCSLQNWFLLLHRWTGAYLKMKVIIWKFLQFRKIAAV